jgi:hypothetical protein
MPTVTLSKSRLLAFRQCKRKLWLEVHRPELLQLSANTKAVFATGNTVGALARRLHDSDGNGVLIDAQQSGFDAAAQLTIASMSKGLPVFEALFRADGAIAFADVMLPTMRGGRRAWRMIEVKSSTRVSDHHIDDVGIQSYLAGRCGVELEQVALATIDSKWTYPGGDDYGGLLVETDLTEKAAQRAESVPEWLEQARHIVGERGEPSTETGDHCTKPYACGFVHHCQGTQSAAVFPVDWLPRLGQQLKAYIVENQVREISNVPDRLLNIEQRRVKDCTISGQQYFDQAAAREELAVHPLPAYFLDFETASFAVPRWAGCRPYQKMPFQFSVHRLSLSGAVEHSWFLDLSGGDPTAALADRLLKDCGTQGAIFVYNRGFESSCIREMAERLPSLATGLEALRQRLVDLLPIVKRHYYHPAQEGSWSIKRVLPAMVPNLQYDDLNGVQDGGGAQLAYVEATDPKTSDGRRSEIERQLLEYCKLDTRAMVMIWQKLAGRGDLDLQDT